MGDTAMLVLREFTVVPFLLLSLTASSDVINVQIEDSELDNTADRLFCCGLVQSKCARACAGRSCSLKCQGYCGPFNSKCGPYQCSAVTNACSSSSTTSSTTMSPSAGSLPGTIIMVGGNLQENNHAIWPRLVELAGEAGIGVLTAANVNAENSGNYYLQMFASWGAQDPYWIPVQEGNPDAASDPEIVARINKLGGVFIGGGEPDRLLACLLREEGGKRVDTPVLTALRSLLARGGLIGATSAGIEVLQSEVVILGGLSWNALAHGAQTSSSDADDLTYDPQGGLGLWPGPIIDAHFRERGRQGRLVQLVRDTRELEHGSTWGIGLDEDTGMECWPANSTCQVLGGSGGVWVAALENDVTVTTHYLTRGDSFDPSDLSVTFPNWKSPLDNQGASVNTSEAIFSPFEFTTLAETLLASGDSLAIGRTERRDPVYAASLTVSAETRAVVAPGSPQYGGGQVSYSHLKLAFCQAADGCN